MAFLETLVIFSGLIFLSEFADKTNLITLTLSAKTRQPLLVGIGAILAIFITSAIAILLGSNFAKFFDPKLLTLLSGVIFVLLGIFTYFTKENDDEENIEYNELNSRSSILLRSFVLIFTAEMGDKSQLIILTASLSNNPFTILLASVIGMGLVIFISAYLGERISHKINESTLSKIAAMLFVVIGLAIILTSL